MTIKYYLIFLLLSIEVSAQMDAWVSNGFGPNLIYFNDGNGDFSDSEQSLGNSISLGVAFGDLDADGDIDIVDAADPGCWVFLNDGGGNLAIHAGFGADLPIVQSIALGDVDLDGDLDIVLGVAHSQFTNSSQVFLNDGSANFSIHQEFGDEDTRSIALANLNEDDYPDLFFANRNEPDTVWFNNGDGTYADSGQSLSTLESFGVSLGDIDSDGDLDAFISLDGPENIIWLNNGFGIFSQSSQVFTASNSLGSAFGDLDGDGDLDIAVGNDGAIAQAPLEIWINNGSGVFQPSAQSLPTHRTVGISLGDVDADGDFDMLLLNVGADKVLINNGAGVFTETGQELSADYSMSGALVYLQDSIDTAYESWSNPYNIISLLQFEDQLEAKMDFRRAR